MPVLSIVLHVTCIWVNWLATSITKFCIHWLETVATKWISVLHYIPHTSKRTVTFKTTEMAHMPASVFCFGTLLSKDNLMKYMVKQKERLFTQLKSISRKEKTVSIYGSILNYHMHLNTTLLQNLYKLKYCAVSSVSILRVSLFLCLF